MKKIGAPAILLCLVVLAGGVAYFALSKSAKIVVLPPTTTQTPQKADQQLPKPQTGGNGTSTNKNPDESSLTQTSSGEDIKKTDRSIGRAEIEAFWRNEDKAYENMPAYSTVRDEYVRKANSEFEDVLLAGDIAKIRASALNKLDAFWGANPASPSPEAYQKAYEARALLEIALEKKPDDFDLLDSLREAIGAAEPLLIFDKDSGKYIKNNAAIEDLLSVLEREKQLVLGGKQPIDRKSFDVMCDWTYLHGSKPDQAVEGWKWLTDNAVKAGYKGDLTPFASGLASAQAGKATLVPSIYSRDFTKLDPSYVAIFSRRLRSFCGSTLFRENSKSLCE
jgi:hypothetical protein